MNRQVMLQALASQGDQPWDVCIIGGGATGLGVAVDAASRGFSTLLLEQYDFAKGTSSRSTKLVHGGVRYLQQGNIKLVMEALQERGILRRNAPHLVKDQSFIVPNYKWWEGPYYGLGLKVYDWMSGRLGLGPSRLLSREETLELAPTLDAEGLRGGVLYHDGQFDDARLAISLAMTAASQGGVLLNYCEVSGLVKAGEKVTGVAVYDKISGTPFSVNAKVVINATGIFTDTVLQMDEPGSEPIMAPSQGVHIVLDKHFLPGEAAILVPHTDDGRVLFAVPWHDKIIIGTTDTPVQEVTAEPRALPQEIDFILQQISRYLTKPPSRADIRSVFAGLRPLVKRSGRRTAELSRDHLISVSASGLITVTGGKWTTYRRMAEDTVNTAVARAGLPERPCRTAELMIHGGGEAFAGGRELDFHAPLYYYGSDMPSIQSLAAADTSLGQLLHTRLPYIKAEIIWAAREELCMTVEDALSRRTRALLLDAAAAVECAPLVAELLARELGRDGVWQEEQVLAFKELARGYQV
ncbi:glycerol-3-phosphate dehydrogenase/oxidase [Flavitalea sp. BT771]|uniref:glycerol-3-phosphate dehydrogenase/oxidase n=1 Tax=Flavitalea sp. BT771 TaxID=3063329 RepID=UPI0026E1C91F|nr:glycerol-3-phosphate dehydrogenase/oxidase [Flavitalea sp. BT771]MDO6433892.1 glycerol-3-phosphate dehydrogenase/oxidase [Flavitalea sp. BT771]MDV6222203.1 glycerol-3-phosphate dehydrogenase/oxidase [Flavitalea sp. BT771]